MIAYARHHDTHNRILTMIKPLRKLTERITRFLRMWETVQYLDRHCLGLTLGNSEGMYMGYFPVHGDLVTTVTNAQKRLGEGARVTTRQ